jgi:hypothetical protein
MRIAVAAVMALLALGGREVAAAGEPVDLRERVCLKSAGARLGSVPDASRQRVECAPHTERAGLPALLVAECEPGARGRCGQAVLAVRAKLGNREVLLTPLGTTFEVALEIATFVGVTHPYTFNGRNLSEMLQGHCLISDRGRGAFAGARDFRVRCGDRGVLVTKACNSTPCRLYPAQFDDAE